MIPFEIDGWSGRWTIEYKVIKYVKKLYEAMGYIWMYRLIDG